MAIAYRAGSTAGNGSGGNLTITKPTGTADGDILVAVCYNEISTSAWTPPAGWAQWGSGRASTSMYLNVFWKRASSEGTDYTFNISSTWRVISMGAFSGALASGDPIDVGPTGNSGAGTADNRALSIITTEADTMVVACHSNYDGGNVADEDSGYTQAANAYLGGCEIWYLAKATAGATGDKDWSHSGASYWATLHLAIKSASGAPAPIVGSFSQTLSIFTKSILGKILDKSVFNKSIENFNLSSVSGVLNKSLLTKTIDNIVISGTGTVSSLERTGTFDKTFDNIIVGFNTKILVNTSLNQTLSGFTIVISGTVGNVIVDNPSINAQNTDVSVDLSADGMTWAQGHPVIVDKYNKIIIPEYKTTNAINFVYSNDSGLNWTDDLNQNFIIRGSLAYDDVNDILHALWSGVSASDGIIYRRYTISRDGSNNITGIVRDTDINLQLDYGASGYEHPVLLWEKDIAFDTYGALVAVWGVYQEGGTNNGCEVRSSMRILSNTIADNTASNWIAPVTDDSSTIDTDAIVPYTHIVNGTDVARIYPSATRKIQGNFSSDIYVAYAISISDSYVYKFRRMRWNSNNNNWSTGLSSEVTLSNKNRSGTDSGYSLKETLQTEFREDPFNDDMVLGISTWKNNIDGDAWSYIRIHDDDTISSIVDVYSSGSSNNGVTIFITGDIVTDSGYVISSYTDLPNKDAYIKVFDSSGNTIQSDTLIFSACPVDIPTLWQKDINARYDNGSGDKLLVAFRDFNIESRDNPPTYTPPYNGYFGTLDWETSFINVSFLLKTLDNLSLSSSAILNINGSLSKTLDNIASSSIGNIKIVAVSNKTIDGFSLSGTAVANYSNHQVSVGDGYTDGTAQQLIRTSENKLWISSWKFDNYPQGPASGLGQTLRMYKADQVGVPSSFTRMNSADEPSNPTSWSMAVDGNDDIHVLWAERESWNPPGTDNNLKYSIFDTTSGSWGSVTTIDNSLAITDENGQGDEIVAIAIDNSSVPHIAYLKNDGTRRRLNYRNKNGGTWSSASIVDDQSFSAGQYCQHPGIFFDNSGSLVFVWMRGSGEASTDGRPFIRLSSGSSLSTTYDITSTNVWPGIDAVLHLYIDSNNRYHLSYLNTSKQIKYRFSDNSGATWTSNDPGSGSELGDDPVCGPGFNGKVRIYAHGWPTTSITYWESDGGNVSWGDRQEYTGNSGFDCTVNVRWSQYYWNHPEYLDIGYWESNYPTNLLYVGVDTFESVRYSSASITLENLSISSTGSVQVAPIIGSLSETLDNISILSSVINIDNINFHNSLSNIIISSVLKNLNNGFLSNILENILVSFGGNVLDNITSQIIFDNLQLSSAGKVHDKIIFDHVFENLSLSSTGNLSVNGLFEVTFDNLSILSSGVLPIDGVFANLLNNLQLSSEATAPIAGQSTGTLFKTLENLTIAFYGKILSNGSLNVVLDNIVIDDLIRVINNGQLNSSIQNFTSSFIGSISNNATLNQNLGNISVSCIGNVQSAINSGVMNVVLDDFSIDSNGNILVLSSSNILIDNFFTLVDGEVYIVGELDKTIENITVVINDLLMPTIIGTLSQILGLFSFSSTGFGSPAYHSGYTLTLSISERIVQLTESERTIDLTETWR